VSFNSLAKIQEKTMTLSKAIGILKDPRLVGEVLDALNPNLSPEARLQHHLDAVATFERRIELFIKTDEEAEKALNTNCKGWERYHLEESSRDALPKNHVDREEASFKLGFNYALTCLAHREAMGYIETMPPLIAALNFFGLVINKNAQNLVKAGVKAAEHFGDQKGPHYFRGEKPIYSGPQNPPLKPSGDTAFTMSESQCWCIYCDSKVEKSEKDKMSPCEHLVCTKCLRMLSSKVTIPGDTRTYDYGNLKKHPHAGTKP